MGSERVFQLAPELGGLFAHAMNEQVASMDTSWMTAVWIFQASNPKDWRHQAALHQGFAVHWQSGTHRLLPRSTAGALPAVARCRSGSGRWSPAPPRPAAPRAPYT